MSQQEKTNYCMVDFFKYVFACLIPFLHISFLPSDIILILREYICRLGVPFFFVCSGFFLYKSICIRGKIVAFKHYVRRIGSMLLFWLLIYSPLIFRHGMSIELFKELVFRTPCFLWYLTALLFGTVVFCLFNSMSKTKYIIGIALYIFGTLFSESYSWLFGGTLVFGKLIITTRNGLFFGFPLMCVGELVAIKSNRSIPNIKRLCIFTIIAYILLCIEITVVLFKTVDSADRSMLFLLPVITYCIFMLIINSKSCIHTSSLFRGGSSAIYVMQYGVIFVFSKIFNVIGITGNVKALLIWITVVSVGSLAYLFVNKYKISKIIF